jgi:hypothetical protein
MKPSETLSFVGTVALTLIHGQISLFGSTINASATRHMIYAPVNYPTATIEATGESRNSSEYSSLPQDIAKRAEQTDSVLVIEDLSSGVEGLNQICGGNHNAKFQSLSDTQFPFGLRQFFPVSKIMITTSSIVMFLSDKERNALYNSYTNACIMEKRFAANYCC